MMKRRWSNNGGFALRMLEESSSEVTSSSAGLVMGSAGMGHHHGGGVVSGGVLTLSPTSLGSNDYGDLEMWYEETAYNQHSVIASTVGGAINMLVGGSSGVGFSNSGGGCATSSQMSVTPLPSMTNTTAMNHVPRSTSVNSISSGMLFVFIIRSILFYLPLARLIWHL